MIDPALAWASRVEAPRCGVKTALGAVRRGLPTGGSVWNTSAAAPASVPDRKASTKAASWTISARAQFTRIAPRFIIANSEIGRASCRERAGIYVRERWRQDRR